MVRISDRPQAAARDPTAIAGRRAQKGHRVPRFRFTVAEDMARARCATIRNLVDNRRSVTKPLRSPRDKKVKKSFCLFSCLSQRNSYVRMRLVMAGCPKRSIFGLNAFKVAATSVLSLTACGSRVFESGNTDASGGSGGCDRCSNGPASARGNLEGPIMDATTKLANAADGAPDDVDGSIDSKFALDAGTECETALDCTALLGPLPVACVPRCGDAGEQCQHYICVSGLCRTTACGGDTTAPPGSPNECSTSQDCEGLLGPLPESCIFPCADGSIGCEHYLCLAGFCQTTYCY